MRRRRERDEELTYHRRGWAEAQVLALHHPGDGDGDADGDADADGCDDDIDGAADADGDIAKRNLSEEFFTASERPKPWDWPQPAGVGDVSTLEGKCESARVRTCESVKVRICESVKVWGYESVTADKGWDVSTLEQMLTTVFWMLWMTMVWEIRNMQSHVLGFEVTHKAYLTKKYVSE